MTLTADATLRDDKKENYVNLSSTHAYFTYLGETFAEIH
jgi:hypothetical protein